MRHDRRYRLRLALAAFWSGMIVAICFLEAWVKFRAPPLRADPVIGLQVGREVFRALHWAELLLLGLALLLEWNHRIFAQPRRVLPRFLQSLLWVVALLLFNRVAILMPELERQIDARLAGQAVAPSWHHPAYGLLAALQALALLGWGWRSWSVAAQGNPGLQK